MFLLRIHSSFNSVSNFLYLPPFRDIIRYLSCRTVVCRQKFPYLLYLAVSQLDNNFCPTVHFTHQLKQPETLPNLLFAGQGSPTGLVHHLSRLHFFSNHSGTELSLLSNIYIILQTLSSTAFTNQSRWTIQLFQSHLMPLRFLYWQ